MKVSVCIITRDESEKLGRALEALKPLDAEIVVVDTGSVDQTRQIAATYTDALYEFPWIDDFAAAKNFAIERAKNDLVLIVDSDEYLLPPEDASLKEALALIGRNPEKVGRVKRISQMERDGSETEFQEYINRLFDRKLYCFSGRIHEQVVRRDGAEYETYRLPLTFTHDGYQGTPEERVKKAKRNLCLLLKEQEENPEDPYLIYQIGKSYYMAGQYEDAERYFERGLGFDLDPKLEYVIDMVESYGYALLKNGRARQALSLENISDTFGNSADFRLLLGLIYMNNEKFDQAVEMFLSATKCETARMRGANSFLAYYNAGVVRECLGDRKNASDFYEKCGNYPKAKERLAAIKQENYGK